MIRALAARLALAGAVVLALAPSPASAQVSAEEATAYAAWQAASTTDLAKASGLAKDYLKQYPAGQYADYLKKWLATSQAAAFEAAIKEKRTADMLKVGNELLALDPDNLNVVWAMASAIRGEMLGRPPVYANAAAGVALAKKGIALVEGGKTLTGVESFDKDATLAWMTQMLALNEQNAGNTAAAIPLFEKSTAYAPKDKAIAAPNLYSVYNAELADYLEAAKAFNALPEADRGAAEPPPSVTAAREKLNKEADAVIDVAVRFVAFGRANGLPTATVDRINQTLESVYKVRFPEDAELAGLQKLLQEKAATFGAPSGD
jgi:hypothetical protein